MESSRASSQKWMRTITDMSVTKSQLNLPKLNQSISNLKMSQSLDSDNPVRKFKFLKSVLQQ